MTSYRLQSNYSYMVTLHGGPVVLRPVRATRCFRSGARCTELSYSTGLMVGTRKPCPRSVFTDDACDGPWTWTVMHGCHFDSPWTQRDPKSQTAIASHADVSIRAVHTSNNVHATLSNATSWTILSTMSNVTSTLLPFLATMWKEISSVRHRRTDECSFHIVAKNGNIVEATFDIVERTKFYDKRSTLLRFVATKSNVASTSLLVCRTGLYTAMEMSLLPGCRAEKLKNCLAVRGCLPSPESRWDFPLSWLTLWRYIRIARRISSDVTLAAGWGSRPSSASGRPSLPSMSVCMAPILARRLAIGDCSGSNGLYGSSGRAASSPATEGKSWSVPQRQPNDATSVQTIHTTITTTLELMMSASDEDVEALNWPASLTTSAQPPTTWSTPSPPPLISLRTQTVLRRWCRTKELARQALTARNKDVSALPHNTNTRYRFSIFRFVVRASQPNSIRFLYPTTVVNDFIEKSSATATCSTIQRDETDCRSTVSKVGWGLRRANSCALGAARRWRPTETFVRHERRYF